MHYKKEFNQVNPRSKRPTTSQNEWLRDCFFDAMGNYLFCSNCIRSAFGWTPQRIARQRSIKRKQSESTQPLRETTKAEVEIHKLGDFIVMPDGVDICFIQWWENLQS